MKLSSFSFIVSCLGGAALVAACGSDPGSQFPNDTDGAAFADSGHTGFGDADFGDASVTSLEIDPPTATLTLDGTTPQSVSYTLKAHLSNGNVVSVQAESLSFNRPDLAQMSGSGPVTLTAPGQYAGTGQLQAVAFGQSASATLIVQIHIKEVG